MKRIVNYILMVVAVCALAGATIQAKGKAERVTLPHDVNIGGTLVKKGDYKLRFDEETGEFLLMKGKKVVARTTARLEKREDKAYRTEFAMVQQGDAQILRSITFRGERESIVVHEGSNVTGTPAAAAPSTDSNP